MIKNIIFDLSEVIISGFHKTEEIIEKNTNIKAEEFLEKRKEVEEIFDNNQFMEYRWEFVRDIIKDMINKQSTHLI